MMYQNLGIDISGRMSASRPNLQNHVKHTERPALRKVLSQLGKVA